MKQIFYLLIIVFIASCGSEQKQLSIIGTRNGDLITVKPFEVKDTVDLNLSELVEDIEIVRLETIDNAIVKPAYIYLSENYILTGSSIMKLFERKTGKFIGNIGNKGRGPGEYRSSIYSAQIDEKSNNIYMLSTLSNAEAQEILVYDMNGKWRGKNIPLASNAPKGVFNIDPENKRLRIAVLPFDGECEYVTWEQNLDGNMINGVKTKHLAAYPDYSNEIMKFSNTSSFDFHMIDLMNTIDTLYHYDGGSKLNPVFNIDCNSEGVWHSYHELPTMFIASINVNHLWYDIFIDKQTLRGAWCRLRNDFLGGYEFAISFCKNGYYAQSVEPLLLFNRIESARESATGKVRERIDYIMDNVKEDDNNVVIIGKLKQ